MRALRTDRPPWCSLPDLHSARTVEAIAFIFGQESVQTHGTPMPGINACLWHRLQLPTKNKTQAAKGRPDLHPTPPQDNQPFVVLLSAGSRGTFCSRTTSPVHCVLPSVPPRSRSDATRAGRRRQTRQEHSHITDGTFTTRRPLPPLSHLVSFQLQDAENPQSLIPTTYRGQLRRRTVTQRRGDFQVGPAAGEPPAPVSHGGSEMGKRSELAQEEVSNGSGGHAEAFLSLLSDEIWKPMLVLASLTRAYDVGR